MYHILNKEFLSPTINLYITTEDFIKFLSNIDCYLESELQQAPDCASFPVGKLNDISIYFNHSTSFYDAKLEWERRKKRIVFNNSYVIIREIDFDREISKETFDFLLSKYKNVIILTFNKNRKSLPHYQYIDIKDCKDEFKKDWCGIDLWDKKWNWIHFINKR